LVKLIQNKTGLLILFLIYAAFIALGMPDGILGVAWPSMRKTFNIPIDAIGPAMITGTIGYLISSFFSGRLISKLSISGLLTLSCALTGISLIADCFVPAWIWYVAIGLLAGFGAGGIDAGLNTYVAANLSERQMHWLHASYGIGITAGLFIMTWGLQIFSTWKAGFLAVGAIQLFLCAAFALSMPSWKQHDLNNIKPEEKKLTDYDTPVLQTLTHAPALSGMLLFFIYTGAEASLGFWAYTVLTEARGIAPAPAGIMAGSFYAVFMAGRMLSGIYAKHLKPDTIVFFSLFLALLGSVLLWLNINPAVSLAGMITAGFAIAPVFPALVSGTKSRVGSHHAGNSIGMQMSSASLGMAFIPALIGVLADKYSPEIITACIPALFLGAIALFLYASKTYSRKG